VQMPAQDEPVIGGFITTLFFLDNESDFVRGLSTIGGSFGKSQMYNILKHTVKLLPEEKPRHLLGIGTVEDIFESVLRGIDTFDCVGPTRIARIGYVYIYPESGGNISNKFRYRITNTQYKNDKRPLDPNCKCKMCKTFTRAYVHHLFKSKEMLAYRIVSYHNLHFFLDLMKRIRESIINNSLIDLYNKWIKLK